MILMAVNLVAVKWFGELESFFSIIKILGIVLFILLGIGLSVSYFHTQSIGIKANFGQLNELLPFGFAGMIASFPMVLFSFAGIEMIGLTVGETSDPQKNLKNAINCLPWRILFFYVGTILSILFVVPWHCLDLKESPLVTMLQMIHCQSGAVIVNLMILVASLSSANSAVYSTSRILYQTAKEKSLPPWFCALSKKGVPLHGILITGTLFLAGLCLHFFVADSRLFFQLLAGMTTSCFLFVWSSILCAHVQFVKEKKRNTTARYKDLTLLVFFAAIAFSLLFERTTRFIPFLLVIWFVFLNFVYKRISNRNIN